MPRPDKHEIMAYLTQGKPSAAETTRTDDTDTRKTTTYVLSSRWTVLPRRRLPWYRSLMHKYSNVHKDRTLHSNSVSEPDLKFLVLV